ncbi:transposase [Modestobacter sp. I12A-02662]|uniref:transposase n=1 Tax=Modestobacter sp. I12A-02662 TaxID=1730496 RepID=UPI0034DE3C41
MAILLTAEQAGDNPQLLPLLDEVSVARVGPGRPRQRPDRMVADRAYSHPSTRAALRARGIPFTSPERTDQIDRRKAKGSAGGRPPAFDAEAYAGRNVAPRSARVEERIAMMGWYGWNHMGGWGSFAMVLAGGGKTDERTSCVPLALRGGKIIRGSGVTIRPESPSSLPRRVPPSRRTAV